MSAALPRLQLGVPNPRVFSSEAQLISELQSKHRPVEDVSFKKPNEQTTIFCAVKLGQMLLTETVTDPIVWKTASDQQLSFVVPINGGGTIVGSNQHLKWGGPHQLLQLNYANPMEAHSDRSHIVAIVPSTEELSQSIPGMKHVTSAVIEKSLECPTEVHSGIFNEIDYRNQIIELLSIVKLAHGNEDYLSRIGVSDIMNRIVAEMLLARSNTGKELDSAASYTSTRSGRAVSIICDHIASHIGTPLTIPKMETMTGLSGRALNYAFQARHNCSPQEWQRNYLLDVARQRLSSNDTVKSIKSLSYDLGFSSSSSFTSHYRRRFGELPTTTQRSAKSAETERKSNYDEYEI